MPFVPRRTIVVPVDFSDSSADALKTARELVAEPGHLHAVHVLLPIDYLSPGLALATLSQQSREDAARKLLEEFIVKHGVAGTTTTIRIGDPGLEVTDYAQQLQADLIVVPSHGYHGIKRFVLGSVAERVIRHADCPVLVLRRRDAE